MSDQIVAITKIKKQLGARLLLLAHHYQRDEIIALADYVGDSLYLAQQAAKSSAQYIVFCGVRFMAESVAILAKKGQRVFLPALEAGCPLADSISLPEFQHTWQQVHAAYIGSVVPITYINSSSAIKAVVGEHNGLVCTSANASLALRWGFQKADKVFFVPDQHLGFNAAKSIGLLPQDMYIVVDKKNVDTEKLQKAKLILWPGACHVHTHFTVFQIQQFRQQYAQGFVVVHPECTHDVVSASDAVGSTTFIMEYVEKKPRGAVVAVGTEIHLVNRLHQRFAGEKLVIPLARSLCPNMYKVNLTNLLKTLHELPAYNEITIDTHIQHSAARSLRAMLLLDH